MGGGAFFAPFVHVDRDGGYVECPRLSTRGGEGVEIGSKLVHVVVECPLIQNLAPSVALGHQRCIRIALFVMKILQLSTLV